MSGFRPSTWTSWTSWPNRPSPTTSSCGAAACRWASTCCPPAATDQQHPHAVRRGLRRPARPRRTPRAGTGPRGPPGQRRLRRPRRGAQLRQHHRRPARSGHLRAAGRSGLAPTPAHQQSAEPGSAANSAVDHAHRTHDSAHRKEISDGPVTETRHDPRRDALRRRTVMWVVGLATVGLIFDGYDLVVYGTVVSTFLRDPSQIGAGHARRRRGARQLRADRRAGRRAARRQRRRHHRPAQGHAVRLRVVLHRHGRHRADEQHRRRSA